MTAMDDFLRYDYDNPGVYELYKEITHFVIKRIRWLTEIETTGDYKVNDHVTPYFARMFMHEYVEHEGFFHCRRIDEAGRFQKWLEENFEVVT